MAAALGTFAADQATVYADKQLKEIKKEGIAVYLADKFVFWGSFLLVAGVMLGVGAYMLQQIGKKAMLDAAAKFAAVQGAFSNVTNPLSGTAWGGWNIGQDFAYVGSALAKTGADVVNGLADLPNAIWLGISVGLPGVGEQLLGATSYSLGWIGEQTFPWLMLIGLALLLVGAVMKTAVWYAKNFHDYLAPRLEIRNKAAKRRWLQRPLDPLIIPERLVRRADEYNKVENVVAKIAYDTGALSVQDHALFLQRRIGGPVVAPSRPIMGLQPPGLAIPEDIAADSLTSKFLKAGTDLPKEEWIELIRQGRVGMVFVPSTGEASELTAQNGLLRRMAGSRGIAAVARVVNQDGEHGAACVGLFPPQVVNIAAGSGQELAYFGPAVLIGRVRDIDEPRGSVVKYWTAVEISEKPLANQKAWFYLPDIGLYFAWFNKPKAPPPPPAPAPPTPEPAVAEPVSEVNEENPEAVPLEELDAMTPEERDAFVRYYPMRVPDAYWEREGRTVHLSMEETGGE